MHSGVDENTGSSRDGTEGKEEVPNFITKECKGKVVEEEK